MKKFLNQMFNMPNSRYFRLVNDFFAALTIISVLGIVLETVPALQAYGTFFNGLEYIVVGFFVVEYLARLYASKHRWKYVFSFFGLIDLISILPTMIGLANLTFLKSARVLRILRLLRMVRLAKIARLHRPVADAEHHASIYKLNIQIYFVALFSAILAFGALIYIVEAPHQAFESIPRGMLWAAEVILGGGITSHFPETMAGQVLGLLARFTGLALLGVLIHVIGHLLRRWLFGEKE